MGIPGRKREHRRGIGVDGGTAVRPFCLSADFRSLDSKCSFGYT